MASKITNNKNSKRHMKKQYTTPEMEVYKVNPSEIICASVSFGEGNTDVMHAAERGEIFEDIAF